MGEGHGFGKVILFGEHFVVYGLPGIVAALGDKTTAKVERVEGSDYELVDNRPETPGYKKEKFEEQKKSLELIFNAAGINPKETPVRVTLAGNLVTASGVGASAAGCAAIARALNEEFNLDFNDEKINEIAFEGEKGYHGTPSGIDNTAATYGGILSFKKNPQGGQPFFEKLKVGKAFEIVEGNSGLTTSTTTVVADVKKMREEKPAEFKKIEEQYLAIFNEAKKALEQGDLKKLGALVNRNQELLREINVSCKELEELIENAKKNGALGAKITGTGRGGLMYALTPGKALQEKVAKAIEKKGFRAFKTTVGGKK